MKGAIPVIGVVGGIGSGKSEVARALGRLGCVVTDSDGVTRAVLRRPEVKAELVRWWGRKVLGADGEVDRAAVARLVFREAAQRERLEGLVHPLIHAERGRVKERAALEGAAALVIDAPLLFEAGVDRECDAVIFVEAPRELREERVRTARGWDEAELRRREGAQMSLEEKRRRSGFVVNNTGALADVEDQVRGILQQVRARFPGAGQSGD